MHKIKMDKLEFARLYKINQHIFEFLYDNIVPKLRSEIVLNMDHFILKIYPSRLQCFTIETDKSLYYIPNNNYLFVRSDYKCTYKGLCDLSNNDLIMWSMVKNFDSILEKCRNRIKEDEEDIAFINNFDFSKYKEVKE